MKKTLLFVALACIGALSCNKKDAPNPTESLPVISMDGVNKDEGNSPNVFSFKVTLSKASTKTVTVDYKTVDNGATAGSDYMAKSGTLTFQPNITEGVIEINVLGDTVREITETFIVALSNPTNAKADLVQAYGTIFNDDTFVGTSNEGYSTPTSYAGYQLDWSDEFGASALNTNDWGFNTGGNGWGNLELQNYTSRNENAFLSAGNLIIEANKESFGGNEYTSARLLTKGKKEFKWGRIDIRAKLPVAQGIWPALWMLGANIDQKPWPACGEIDIMELVGKEPKNVYGTLHWGSVGDSRSQNTGNKFVLTQGDFDKTFHVFSIIWAENNIEWLIDDKSFLKLSSANVQGSYPFNEKFFLIFNVAVGGQWPGSPDASTTWPQRMFVDYVRVFKKV